MRRLLSNLAIVCALSLVVYHSAAGAPGVRAQVGRRSPGVSSSGFISGSAIITGGTDTYVCFDDGGTLSCADSGITFDKTNDRLMLAGATNGTSNKLGIINVEALGAVTDWATVRVQSAPATTNATGAAFGMYSTFTNSSSTVGTTGHMVGVMGNVTDTPTGRITMYGMEARVDGRSTDAAATHSYVGATTRGFFQGASVSNSVFVIGDEAFCNITTDGSTPLSSGVCLGIYVPAAVGGAAKYSLYAVSDSIYAGGGIDLQHLSDTTLARVSAGVMSVEGKTVATLSDPQTWSAAQALTSITLTSTLTSSATANIGWTVVAGTNVACNTTCTSACAFGWNITAGNITGTLLACTDATADACLCIGPS